MARLNNATFSFNNNLDASNSLSFNSVNEFKNYLDETKGTETFELSYIQQNPNEKLSIAKLDISIFFDLSIRVKQELDPYKFLNVTSDIEGMTLGRHWNQKEFSVSIDENIVTIDIIGMLSVSVTQGGVGTIFEKERHFRLKINKLTGQIFGTYIL
ncbi:hypothetical protein NAT50_07510 [Flavobacterium sp. HXWNR70]|uniref:Uncharacterized protein n=1 Tax=Flavobacterium luminosum TaxID=2949086 RepID=A0ABT0TPB1_9FLAO|nr:hypothetical protein [Flavobacterium sp. HXWNR70]